MEGRVWIRVGEDVKRVGLVDGGRLPLDTIRSYWGFRPGTVSMGFDMLARGPDGASVDSIDVIRKQNEGQTGETMDTALVLVFPNELPRKMCRTDGLTPFVGREGEVEQCSRTIKQMVDAFYNGMMEAAFSFITIEGGSGVGKSRFLAELSEEVKYHANANLSALYRKGVKKVRLDFRGKHIISKDSMISAEEFIALAMVDELSLDQKLGAACRGSFSKAMSLLAQEQPTLVYVQMDELQVLSESWVRELVTLIAEYMVQGQCLQDNLIIIPVVAGTMVGNLGLHVPSTWAKTKVVLQGLLPKDTKKLLVQDVSPQLLESPEFGLLLRECMGVPLFITWVLAGLRSAQELDFRSQIITAHCRDVVEKRMQQWLEHVFDDARPKLLEEAFRLCLTGGKVLKHSVVQECLRGYVYWSYDGLRYTFRAPMILLRYLSDRLQKLHEPLVDFNPVRGGTSLEVAGLEMLYVRLLLARTQLMKLGELLVGSSGGVCKDFKVAVPAWVCKYDEVDQYLVKKHALRRPDDATVRVKVNGIATVMSLPKFGLVTKCLGNNGVVDGRFFLRLPQAEPGCPKVLEGLVQFKGDQKLLESDYTGWCSDAFNPDIVVAGRCRVLVLITPYTYMDQVQKIKFLETQAALGRYILLIDQLGCAEYMPGYFERT